MKPSRLYAAWMLVALLAFALFGVCRPAHAEFMYRKWTLWTGAAGDTTAVGMADSSEAATCATCPGGVRGAIGTGPYQRLTLTLQPSRPCRIAIQVRKVASLSSDTANVSLPSDTTAVAVIPWRAYTHVLSDSTTGAASFTQKTAPTSVVGGTSEYVVEFADYAGGTEKWGHARALVLDLRKLDTGAWMTARALSIRYRVLSAGGVVTMRGMLEGFGW